MSDYSYSKRDWRETCDCGAAHDTYNGPSFPLSKCSDRACGAKACSECKVRCDDCDKAFCERCVVTFEGDGKQHSMCFECVMKSACGEQAEAQVVAA